MIKYVYALDYSPGQKRAYLEWVRSIADTLQAPDELIRLVAYESYFSASPQRVVEFEFDTLESAANYFARKEISKIFQAELPAHATNISMLVLKRLEDYHQDTA